MSDKDVLKEAQDRFKSIQDHEAKNRTAWIDDVRFSRLGEQWPDEIRRQREKDGRPCLTINRLPSFIRQVTNDARQNKPSIVCHPVGDGADKQTAHILNGLIRNIQYTSNAEVAYDTAIEHAVSGGFGYFRISTEYAHDDSFDQDLRIERVSNPLSIYGDNRSTAADSSDWNVAFVTERYTKAEFEAKFGKGAAKSDFEANDDQSAEWLNESGILVAEYWTRDETPTEILKLSDGIIVHKEQYLKSKDYLDELGITIVGTRPSKTMKVTQRIITGSEILETNKWAGRYIPIVPVYGDEVLVEGERTFLSLIRPAKDSQQMMNYWRTASTELVALAPKTPFIGPKGFATSSPEKWASANMTNHAYLEYDGPTPPQRQPFAGPPAGAIQEALNASDDMKSIMGIHDASLGARSNETSGRAIIARQKEGDTSTFNFIDNMSRAIRHAGRILVDMIPHVYNVERIIRVIQQNGDNEEVPINQPIQVQPGQQPPGQPKREPDPNEIHEEFAQGMTQIYDLTVGKYDVVVEAGPSFNTKREEAAFQMTEFVRAFPDAAPVIGDLIAKNLDWPGAEEIGERLKRLLPPGALQPNQQMMAMQQQMQLMDQQAKEAVGQLQQQLADKSAEQAATMAKLEIDKINAETNRMKAIGDQKVAEADLRLQAIVAQNTAENGGEQPQATQPSQPSQPQQLQLSIGQNEESMTALAAAVTQSQQVMADALQQNTQALAQLQSLTVDAIEDMAEAISAPRQIKLHHGANGRTTGATSVVVMAEPPGVQ